MNFLISNKLLKLNNKALKNYKYDAYERVYFGKFVELKYKYFKIVYINFLIFCLIVEKFFLKLN